MNNLIKRALTGIIFVAILLGALCFHPILYLLVFSLITALSLWEFYGLIKHYENANIQRVISCIGGAYLFIATFAYANGLTDGKIFLPYILFIMYTFIAELYNNVSNPINNWSFTLLAQVYCAGSFSLLNFITSTPNTPGEVVFNPIYTIALFVFIWLNDTGAYLVGSRIGKRRLFERISPKKSWEGFFGGLIVVLAASQAFVWYAPEISWYNWLGLSFSIVLFGTWGDLTESLLKRTLGVKDSGNLLPGHGGMLDRFDSVMMAIPTTYIYIELFIRN
ncbi:phosphatidate cytidylyltransferase [Parabacteroides bouchesdurhonensis]|uniref:phosphatidate cytidylyltransferase n=1 Tax=Parabacteroides bouchesdurhonensis TaxID=1936995 RepID=UPI000E53B55F|nr:phosphatidate cytidylyltransferase [Parabacteroides bouchesdurhonensis]RHJ92492.1 phosphatidate cytidylyltransferase [Bacteroides sp. AM07-16]